MPPFFSHSAGNRNHWLPHGLPSDYEAHHECSKDSQPWLCISGGQMVEAQASVFKKGLPSINQSYF